ncbi:MAG: hypothetical protein H8Z69_03825 [Nanohaloarchaea archaeon]|nr:hypothetical protein [Candidatus Nanohaloarchaea archaeon]
MTDDHDYLLEAEEALRRTGYLEGVYLQGPEVTLTAANVEEALEKTGEQDENIDIMLKCDRNYSGDTGVWVYEDDDGNGLGVEALPPLPEGAEEVDKVRETLEDWGIEIDYK